MRYIRTKDGRIVDIFLVSSKERTKVLKTHNTEWIVKNNADTIPELCDEFVVAYEDGYRITYSDLDWAKTKAKASLKFGHKSTIYGAIWIKGEHDEPILKSVAKLNEEEDLCLL